MHLMVDVHRWDNFWMADEESRPAIELDDSQTHMRDGVWTGYFEIAQEACNVLLRSV